MLDADKGKSLGVLWSLFLTINRYSSFPFRKSVARKMIGGIPEEVELPGLLVKLFALDLLG